MKVILLQDIKTLGKKDDIVEVSQGYARNLLVKKQAVEATSKNLNDLKLQHQHKDKLAQEQYDAAVVLAESLKDKSVTVSIRCGSDGRTFGSVSTKELLRQQKSSWDWTWIRKKWCWRSL